MAKKVKVELDNSPPSESATGGTAKWSQNQHKLRAVVLIKTPGGAPLATLKFYRICNFLKGSGLVFDSADPRVDCFTHVKLEIDKYIGK